MQDAVDREASIYRYRLGSRHYSLIRQPVAVTLPFDFIDQVTPVIDIPTTAADYPTLIALIHDCSFVRSRSSCAVVAKREKPIARTEDLYIRRRRIC